MSDKKRKKNRYKKDVKEQNNFLLFQIIFSLGILAFFLILILFDGKIATASTEFYNKYVVTDEHVTLTMNYKGKEGTEEVDDEIEEEVEEEVPVEAPVETPEPQ